MFKNTPEPRALKKANRFAPLVVVSLLSANKIAKYLIPLFLLYVADFPSKLQVTYLSSYIILQKPFKVNN
jgi:hypothetical protein